MNTITDRLQSFMDYKGLNPNKITVEAGLSVGLISKSIKNKTGLYSETIEKILSAYNDLNPAWLLTGKGEMILNEELKHSENTVLDYENSRMLRDIKELSDEDQQRILITIDALVRDAKNRKTKK